jgi:peptidase M28-like protein
MTGRLSLLYALLVSQPLDAQAPGPLDGAAETITAHDLRAKIEVLAHDSMMGRDTPSPGLERAAAYVVGEFRRLGLQPAGETGTYVQRFGVSRWTVDTGSSSLELAAGGARAKVAFGSEVRVIGGDVSGKPIGGGAVLLAGPLTPAVTATPRLRGRIVILAPDFEQTLPFDLGERVDQIAAVARAVILLSNRDSSAFTRRIDTSLEPRLTPDFRDGEGGAPVVELHESALGAVARAAALDLSRLRALDTAVVQELPGLRVDLRIVRHYLERAAAPNVAAVLEGRDHRLRGEYVVISAHLDHVGVRPGRADSIFNGADDNASGVAGLLELAEAFSRREARPERSLLFLVPSGEEKGLWGSAYYVEHPTVQLSDVVADLNMDLVGRNWADSVIVTGPDMSSLGETLRRVSAAHPELRMAPLADRWPEERIFYRSDHYNFAVKGVPVLFFTSGTHSDYHQPTDVADRIDTEKASRLVRLVFHVSAAVANAAERPRWDSASRRRLVEER